jgi:hypothetical protein
MTRSQPDLPRGERAPLKGCAFAEAEARELAALIFLGIEFDKPDVVQELEYDLILASPRLVVIPFAGASKWRTLPLSPPAVPARPPFAPHTDRCTPPAPPRPPHPLPGISATCVSYVTLRRTP